MITTQSIKDLIAARNGALPPGDRFPQPPIAWVSQCADALEAQREKAALTSPLRVRQFMAQIAHESGGFRRLVENLKYTNPERLEQLFSNVQTVDHARRLIAEGPVAIGSCVYAHRNGNGSIDSGDGYRFRGRGFLMNTGRANYQKVARYASEAGYQDMDVVADPDLLGRPDGAAKAAAAFWLDNHLNAAADTNDADEVTRIVNGKSMQGAAQRRGWVEAGEAVWPDAAP